MARNLYRFYLYVVFILMLIFATVGLTALLQVLFSLTGLRGSYSSVPTSATVTQTIVFFAVSWFIAALVGGLHYWLIRRDMRSDPATGGSNAIRSFFLSITELIAAPNAIGVGASVISQLGQGNDLASGFAITLALLALVAVLELERRRSAPGTPVGLFFQRFSLYGIQFSLLIVVIFTSIQALNILVDRLFFAGAAYRASFCGDPLNVGCQGPNVLDFVGAALWAAFFWLMYGLAGRKAAGSLLQRIAYYISFAIGVIFTLYGVGQVIALGILNASGTHVAVVDVVQTYNFTATLFVGLSVIAVYVLWLRSATRQQSIPPVAWQTVFSIVEAIVAGLMALAFYAGAAAALFNLFESPVSILTWSGPLASMITGIGYIAFDIHLYRRWKQDVPGARDARRGLVFALLGAGVLATAIGGAFALYTVISNALGSPLDNWQHIARAGAATAVVGLLILLVYLLLANRQKLLVRTTKSALQVEPSVAPAPIVAQTIASPTIEGVLDALLTGELSRDEAAARIHEIAIAK